MSVHLGMHVPVHAGGWLLCEPSKQGTTKTLMVGWTSFIHLGFHSQVSLQHFIFPAIASNGKKRSLYLSRNLKRNGGKA